MSTTTTTLTVKKTAAALRKALRETFPGTKFSVRMSTGTGYGWLRVEYTDGPTSDKVRALADTFESERFNAMTDSYDLTEHQQWNCQGVNITRNLSDEAVSDAITKIERRDTYMCIVTDEASAHSDGHWDSEYTVARKYLNQIDL